MKRIKKNEIWYKCGSAYGCWGNYVVCNKCFEYGILRFMMDNTRDKKYNSLNKLEKYELEKQHGAEQMEKVLKGKEQKKGKGIHFYSKYPHHFDENIHCPLKHDTHAPFTIDLMADMADNNKETSTVDDRDSDDSNDSSSHDSDDSDSNSDSDSDNDKGDDEAPNFKQGNGRKFMNYILRKPKYWNGDIVLKEKEWREIYWMDIGMQLKWLMAIRYRVFNTTLKSVLKNEHLNIEIASVIMEMICGTPAVTGCFVKNK
eukprot:314612_1